MGDQDQMRIAGSSGQNESKRANPGEAVGPTRCPECDDYTRCGHPYHKAEQRRSLVSLREGLLALCEKWEKGISKSDDIEIICGEMRALPLGWCAEELRQFIAEKLGDGK